ncbi:MAG: hypothetical protein ACLRQF_18580 [Thomasclavelia ramosa]
MSGSILVMYEGEIVTDLNPKETNVEELGLYMADQSEVLDMKNKAWTKSFLSSLIAIYAV